MKRSIFPPMVSRTTPNLGLSLWKIRFSMWVIFCNLLLKCLSRSPMIQPRLMQTCDLLSGLLTARAQSSVSSGIFFFFFIFIYIYGKLLACHTEFYLLLACLRWYGGPKGLTDFMNFRFRETTKTRTCFLYRPSILNTFYLNRTIYLKWSKRQLILGHIRLKWLLGFGWE
jgi:hypothetical protein